MAIKATSNNLNQSSNQTLSGRSENAVLNLQTKNGKKVELNAKRLEELFAQTEHNIQQIQDKTTSAEKKANTKTDNLNSPELATQFLSRFGFKGPHDLIVFLKSPAGESTRRAIGEELAEIASMKKYNQFLLQEREKRRHRLMALMLMYFTKKAEAKNRQQRNADSEYKKFEEKKLKKQTKRQSSYAKSIERNISDIDEKIERLNNELDMLRKKQEIIEKTYKSDKEGIQNSNDILKPILESLDQDIPTAINDLKEKNIILDEEIKQSSDPVQIQQLQEQKELNEDYILFLTGKKEIADLNILKKLETNLDNLNNKLMEKADTLEPGEEHEASALQNEIRKTSIQLARIVDILQARKGNREMVGLHFEQVSHDKVHFYLPKDKALELRQAGKYIESKDGNNYLLQEGQDFVSLSIEEKLKANKDFNREIDPSNCEELGQQIDRHLCLASNENKAMEQQVLEQQQIANCEKTFYVNELKQLLSQQINKQQAEQTKQANPTLSSEPNKTLLFRAVTQSGRQEQQNDNPKKPQSDMTALSCTKTKESMKPSLETQSEKQHDHEETATIPLTPFSTKFRPK